MGKTKPSELARLFIEKHNPQTEKDVISAFENILGKLSDSPYCFSLMQIFGCHRDMGKSMQDALTEVYIILENATI